MFSYRDGKASDHGRAASSPAPALPRIAFRDAGFLILVALSLTVFRAPLGRLVNFSLAHEYGSHVLFIPLISVGLFYLRRENIFAHPQVSLGAGAALLMVGGWKNSEYSVRSKGLDFSGKHEAS